MSVKIIIKCMAMRRKVYKSELIMKSRKERGIKIVSIPLP